ncbi:Peptidase M76, ATP23 [Sesbania bispinosa]|nr:Peptidase M76, ATP23 [Sesbania bispinosa]
MTEDLSSFDSSANGGVTVKECQRMIQHSLQSPMVRFLREHLEKAGCSIGDNFIKAINCAEEKITDTKVAGGYIRGEGIVVCSNETESQDGVNQVIIHELIHAFDDCRAANLDWTDCAHHACSEIRAGHLSGDCHYKRELLQALVNPSNHVLPMAAKVVVNGGVINHHRLLSELRCDGLMDKMVRGINQQNFKDWFQFEKSYSS